jgi:hypothetical protein
VHHRRVYKYAVEEELLDHSRPRMSGGGGWTTSLMVVLDRNELGAYVAGAAGNRAYRLGKAPPPTTANPDHHVAVTHRDLRANRNRLNEI